MNEKVLNEKEKEALGGSICRFIRELVHQADEFNIDRDSYIKADADLLCVMSSASTFKYYDVEKGLAEGAKVDTHTREG